MDSLALQLASLVKNNNGKFKSEKQAKFFLDNVLMDDYICMGGSMYGNSYTIFYHMDKIGVYKVEKHLFKTNKTVITFERESDDVFNAKRIKFLEYSIKDMIERLENFSLLSFQKRDANNELKQFIKAVRNIESVPKFKKEYPNIREDYADGHLNKVLNELAKKREACSKEHREEKLKELETLKKRLEKFKKELNDLKA